MEKSNEADPLKRMVEKDTGAEELSPMDPPDAFSPPAKDAVPFELLHPFLQELINEHKTFSEELNEIENTLQDVQKNGFSRLHNEQFAHFFKCLDEDVIRHQQFEDSLLFPMLEERLIKNEHHSKAEYPKTPVDIMRDEHTKVIQLSALAFNMMSLAFRLPDKKSSLMVLDLSIDQSKQLLEVLKLHIFREDNIIFGLAHKYIEQSEFDSMYKRFKLLPSQQE